jgi:hypothetical protein
MTDTASASEIAFHAIVEFCVDAVGHQETARALDAIDTLSREEWRLGSSERRTQLLVNVHVQRAHQQSDPNERKEVTRRRARDMEKFLEDKRRERLRQSIICFNVTLALIIVILVLLIAGLICAAFGMIEVDVISAIAGVIATAITGMLFKLCRDANDRLDKIKVNLIKVNVMLMTVDHLGYFSYPEREIQGISDLANALRKMEAPAQA